VGRERSYERAAPSPVIVNDAQDLVGGFAQSTPVRRLSPAGSPHYLGDSPEVGSPCLVHAQRTSTCVPRHGCPRRLWAIALGLPIPQTPARGDRPGLAVAPPAL
jgi:hypothetical protein